MKLFPTQSRLRHITTVVVTGFLMLSSYFIIWSYYNSLEEAEQTSLMRLAGIANTLALQIDGDAHQYLMHKYTGQDAITTSDQDSLYQSIHKLLRRNYEANMLKTPLYTLVLDTLTNTCVFGVTSAEMPYFRHTYSSPPAVLIENHRTSASIPRYEDEFGVWLSAFAAVRNHNGDVVAVVQADQRFDDFMRQTQLKLRRNVLIGLAALAVLLSALILVLQPILRKEQADKKALADAYAENSRISEQLRESLDRITALDHVRKEMIANLSHDLRTPMASMLGYLETVLSKNTGLSPEAEYRYLNVAFTEAKRLNRLVGNLFELSKLESGQMQLHPEPFNIAELAQDTLQKYKLNAEARHIELRTELAENLPLVRADVRWIDRVLQNLMDNALRYAGEGGFVLLTVFEQAGKLHFKVCNSGDPIPEEQLDHIFDRYFTAKNRSPESTGLGLAIVKRIIDLHQERVWAEVNGEVTTFRFTLSAYIP